MHGGLLGRGRGAVDADVVGGELVGAARRDQPAGPTVTDLVVHGELGGVVVRVRLGLLLADPLVDGLAVLLLPGRVAVALAGGVLLGRAVAALGLVLDVLVEQEVPSARISPEIGGYRFRHESW